jgi:hypothetical protein
VFPLYGNVMRGDQILASAQAPAVV